MFPWRAPGNLLGETSMPTTYTAAMSGSTDLADADFTDAPPGGSLGATFLQECGQAHASPAANMTNVNTMFHNFLAAQGWTWAPEGAGNSYLAGAALLDGTTTAGECGFPAYALALLVNAPAPYGFGTGGATVRSYSGANREGFIARHAHPLPGPTPNITKPDGLVLNNYYYWGNHKVVELGGHFYDPNLRADYPNLAGMAEGSLQTVRQNVRLRDLKDYNPSSPWGLLLAWGLPRLTLLKISDVIFGTTHTITVTRTTVGADMAVAGHYIEWSERFALPAGGREHIYGPLPHSPLVR
jgi:hypothetical protein